MSIEAFTRRLAAALVLGLAGVSATYGSARAAHDELTIGISQFPSSLNPYIEAEDVKLYVLGFVTPRVTGYGEGARLSCILCTQVPTVQNGLAKIEDRTDGSKGMAVTLELTPGLKWGDGEPVTTKDIAFTARVAADPKSGFSLPKAWAKIEKVEIVDDRKAIIHLNSLYVSYNEWAQLLPEHIEGPAYEKVAGSGGYNKESLYNRAPTTAGLYDGPYLVKDYQSGAQIILEPNPYWNGTKPYFKRIIVKFIGNTAALEANLLSGDVDMVAEGGIGLTVDQALELRKKYPDRFTYMFMPNLFMEHIELAHDNPMLQDVRIRQALVYAADRKTLTEKLFENMLPVASSFVPPSHANAAKDLPVLPYDPEKAKALLAEAGFTPGPDGICRNAKGERLSFEFTTTAGNRVRELEQQVLQSNWKSACIEVTIKNEPARTMFGETLKKRKFTGMVMFASGLEMTESPRNGYTTSGIPTEANGYGGSNYSGISIPRFDELTDLAEKEFDPEKQKVLWAEMQKIYATQLPQVPIYFRADAHVVPKWLKGYTPSGIGDATSNWSFNWRAE